MKIFLVAVTLVLGVQAVTILDVPLGECHGCEVTCFEDCSLKYDREIMQADLLQIPQGNHTGLLKEKYGDCLTEDKCPCEKEDAKKALVAAKKGQTALVQNASATCAVENVPCAAKCGQKVVSNFQSSLKAKSTKPVKKQALLQKKEYPIHSVRVGVFSHGQMNMDQCLKFCLAATCGCDKAPGLDTIDKLFKAIKENDAAVPGEKDFSHHKASAVKDTHQSEQFRPAEIKECAKGMIGKKVSKGLWIDMGDGVGGELEVCSKKFLERVFGPGDHSKQEDLCKSTKSDDAVWGCIWDDTKQACVVGFSPNLRCQKKFIRDPTSF